MWGAEITLTNSNLGFTNTTYSTSSKTISDVTFNWVDLCKKSGETKIQAKGSSGEIWNSTAVPGKITNVTINQTDNTKSSNFYIGTVVKTTDNTSAFSTNGANSKNATSNWCQGYFHITRGSNAAYWSSIVITYTPATITPSTSNLSGFNYNVGSGPSASQTFTISGSNIPDTLLVTAPTDFEVSLDGSSWGSSKRINVIVKSNSNAGTLSSTTVYVRLAAGKSAGNYSGNVSVAIENCNASTGVTPKTVAVNGTVTAASCSADPTIGAVSLNGSFNSGGVTSLTNTVSFSTTSCDPNTNCEWQDYGFVWGTSASPTVSNTKMQKGTSGNATSWDMTSPSTFTVDNTYKVRAYGKNGKTGAAFVYSSSDLSFTPRSVTFNSNGGSAVATKYIKSGGAMTAPTAPTKTGYNFDSWRTDAGLGTAVSWPSTINSSTTYYAKWNAKTYAITLNANTGAGSSPASVNATYNAHALSSAITNPTKTDYIFEGWNTKADGSGLTVIGTDGELIADVSGYTDEDGNWTKDGTETLYAKWTEHTYTNYRTSCCTDLGYIHGIIQWPTPTKATIIWDAMSNVAASTPYVVTYRTGSDSYSSTNVSAIRDTLSTKKYCTITGLTAGTSYDFKIAVTGKTSPTVYCDKDSVITATAPKITVSGTPSSMSYVEGDGPSAPESFSVSGVGLTGNLTVTAPTNFEVCKTSDGTYTSSVTLTPTSGTVSSTTIYVRLAEDLDINSYGPSNVSISGGSAATVNVSVSGVVSPSCHTPTISANPSGATYNMNATATALSVTAAKGDEGDPSLTYQWYVSATNDNTAGSVIGGATSSTYTPPTTTAGTKYYYCVVYSGACSKASTCAAVTVNTPTLTASVSSCAFSTKKIDGTYTMTLTISGTNLAKDATVAYAIGGDDDDMFSVTSPSSPISQTSTGALSATTVTVQYAPTSKDDHSATLTFSSTGASNVVVNLTGTGQYVDTYMTAMHEADDEWEDYAEGVTKAGDGYTIPNPGDVDKAGTSCEGKHYHFAGWVENTYKASPSGHIVAGSGTKDASNKTFWAVWEKEAAGGAGAPVNTVLWAEDFSGWGDGDVPDGDDITNSHTGTTVYGSATLTYACVNGGSNTKLYGANQTLYAGGSAPELLVGKSTGSFTVSGIPNGGASEITVSYKQNNKALTVAASGTGYSGSATNTPASATTESFDVTVGSDATFTLTFTPSTDNVRIDDISVKVKTQGITYEDPKVECICSADPVAGTAAVDAEGTFSASSIAVKATSASTGHADCSYTDYGFVWSSSVTTPTLVEGTGAASTNCTKVPVGNDGQVTTFAGSITSSFTANTPIYVRSYVKNGKEEGTYQYSSVVTITPRSVTFNLNGHGSSAPVSQFVNNGSKATDPSYSESVTGYIFGGWYKEEGCSNAWNFATDVVSGESKTLYAKWTPISYSVRFNNNDENYLGTATGEMSNESFDYDEEKALTTNTFSLAGYDFAGWATTPTGDVAHLDEAEVENLSSTNGATVDLYAIWTAKKYNVTLAATNETSSVGSQTVQATYNAAMPLVTTADGTPAVAAPSRTGYTFTGWEYSSTTYYNYNAGTSTLSSAHVWDQPNSTTTLTPKWSINSYTLTWNLGGGTVATAGTGAEAGATGTPSSSVVYNSAITVPTVTKAGYDFAGWDVTPASNMPASDVTYTATWTAKTLNSISLAEASVSVYVGEIKYVNVIFDPTDILSKAFGQVATPSYCQLNSYDSYNKLKITGGRAGADISVNRTETVSIKYTADETKTASISVTVKPLPTVTFVDLIHNKSDFANSGDGWTAGTGVLSSTETTGVVSHAKKTPTHTDVTAPVGGNACETGHLHLMGWIRSDYSKVADYMNGTGEAPSVSDLTTAGAEYWFLPDADINTETYDGKTFYAVWAVEE
jgi:uncharacterized repeat protein (TIGR02543 family)